MRYLLYCIFRQGREDREARAAGSPDGGGPEVIAGHGLAAAASFPVKQADVPELLRYAEVIAGFHARRTVIPLRYGCVLPSRAAVLRLLGEQRARFQALLSKLDGTVEMGLRVLCPEAPPVPPEPPSTPGAGYLAAARRRHEARGDLLTTREAGLADHFCAVLSGLYADERREVRLVRGARLLALDFLVPRASLDRFRKRVARAELPPYLLTGPWPPYHFADLEHA